MLNNLKHIFSLVFVIAVAYGAYYVANNTDMLSSTSISSQDVQARTMKIQQDIIVGLEQMQNVELDGSFFTSEEFSFLQDKTVSPDVPERMRENPFLPYQ